MFVFSHLTLWTTSQRKALLTLGVVLAMFLTIQWLREPVDLADPLPNDGPRVEEIMNRLNPNTADAAALSAIPNLGEKRAAEIIGYRENFIRQHPNSSAFNSTDDLRNIKGFGPATAANLAPYLMFKTTGPVSTDLTVR